MLAELLRALPVAVLVGTMPGYFWARCLSPTGDRVELLAYSTALSMALVPTAALVQTRVLGTGVTLPVAALSAAAVFAGGIAAYLWFGRPDDEPLPASPPAPWSAYAMVTLPLAFGLMLATALAPVVGYDKAAEISKEAYKTGKTIREVARESTDLSEEDLDRLLDARKMT